MFRNVSNVNKRLETSLRSKTFPRSSYVQTSHHMQLTAAKTFGCSEFSKKIIEIGIYLSAKHTYMSQMLYAGHSAREIVTFLSDF